MKFFTDKPEPTITKEETLAPPPPGANIKFEDEAVYNHIWYRYDNNGNRVIVGTGSTYTATIEDIGQVIYVE